MAINKTDRILRNIQSYAISSVIVTAIITAIIAIFPLYLKLENIEKRNVLYTRNTNVFMTDQYLLRLKDIGKQIASRTRAAQLLQEYATKKISKAQLTTQLNTILLNALHSSTQLVGVTRINNTGEILGLVGKVPPNDIMQDALKIKTQIISGPTATENQYFINIVTPIYAQGTKQRIGTDIALFNIADLHAKISHHIQSELGDTLISYLKNDKPNIFFKNLTEWGEHLHPDSPLYKILYTANKKQSTRIITTKLDNVPVIIAHAPTNQSPWSIAVIIKKTELTAALKRTLWSILAVITIAVIFFIAGLGLILKPISSRILIEHAELEKRIKKGQAALQQANKKLHHMANHDFLTGLLNRRGLNHAIKSELSRAKRHTESFTLLYIDINGFKEINDQKGHAAGDHVLQTIATRLNTITRKEDSVARIGGDEFAIIATSTEKKNIATLLEKIKNSIENTMQYNQQIINCKVSIGTALFPEDGKDIDSLMRQADKQMYLDKKNYESAS